MATAAEQYAEDLTIENFDRASVRQQIVFLREGLNEVLNDPKAKVPGAQLRNINNGGYWGQRWVITDVYKVAEHVKKHGFRSR